MGFAGDAILKNVIDELRRLGDTLEKGSPSWQAVWIAVGFLLGSIESLDKSRGG